jgi:hypothetical protein
MKIILLNGPPGCGKDFAAKALVLHFCRSMSVRWERFSRPNKHAFAGTIGVEMANHQYPMQQPDVVLPYELEKEKVIDFLGVSYRQWQIDYSEKFMKPLYGQDIFAKLFLQRNAVRLGEANWLCVVSDCGFQNEYDVVSRALPIGDVFLINIQREGKSFAGDSREWVKPAPDAEPCILLNRGDESFTKELLSVTDAWLKP